MYLLSFFRVCNVFIYIISQFMNSYLSIVHYKYYDDDSDGDADVDDELPALFV